MKKNEHGQSSKCVVITGFSLILILLIAVVSISAYSISDNSHRLSSIVNEHKEMHNVFAMRDAAHKRALMLYRMAAINDPFERDDLFLRFREEAVKFIVARDKLLEDLNEEEEFTVWDKVKPYVVKGGNSQNETINLIMDGEIGAAYDLLVKKVIPTQDNVMNGLTEMLSAQTNLVTRDLNNTNTNNHTLFVLIVALGLSAILLGVTIMIYVTRFNSHTEQALLEQKAIANSANQAKSNFLANMSHEIRTPLTAIIGFSESLEEDEIPEQDRRKINKTITRNSKHLLQIINDVLDISKIEAGQLDVEKIGTSPVSITSEIESIMGMRARDKGLDFRIHYQFPLPTSVQTDPTRLKQILINLTGNAIKFTHEGSITINLAFDKNSNQIQFEIVDTGIGMDEEAQQKIFDPFSQADSSTTRKFGGTGLGLTISRQLAEKLGGRLTCSSKEGIGSKFTLTIDAGEGPHTFMNSLNTVNTDAEASRPDQPVANLAGNILLAEDSVDNQQLISMYINKTDATLQLADNGKQAVELATAHDYDLVLMDMQMPVMDGVEAINTLRKQGYTKPIVALTANAMKTDRDRCINAGANDYLVKPINVKHFYKTLRRFLPEKTQSDDDFDFDNDPEFLALVDRFLDRLPGWVNQIDTAYKNQQWNTIMAEAHKLKGMGGAFGQPEITRIAERIDALCKSRSFSELQDPVRELLDITRNVTERRKSA